MPSQAFFHPASAKPLLTLLVLCTAVGQGRAQGDLEAQIAERSQAVQKLNSEIVLLRNSLSALGDEHRRQAASQIVVVQDAIRAAIGRQRQAQQRIDEHTNTCDVIVAQRNGQPVAPIALANHNRDLAEARMELAAAQSEEQTHRIKLAPLQQKADAVAPAEVEVRQRIAQLTAEVRGQETSLFALRSQRSQQLLQDSIRKSVEALSRPAAAPAIAEAVATGDNGNGVRVQEASAIADAARRSLAELARRAIGELPADDRSAQALLDALPPRPKPAPALPAPAVVAPKPAAAVAPVPAVEAIDVDEFLLRLPKRSPAVSPAVPPAVPPAPAPAPAGEAARPAGDVSAWLDELRSAAKPGSRQ
ncbi:MAG: hypothetical protein MUC36_04645 [Planctomycetes bacterium]|jgi:hypothetical protein|nr:hypothetical protein [Planctomycetota bacterium]